MRFQTFVSLFILISLLMIAPIYADDIEEDEHEEDHEHEEDSGTSLGVYVHMLFGSIGLVLGLLLCLAGRKLAKGEANFIGIQSWKIHKYLTLSALILVVSTFLLGIYNSYEHSGVLFNWSYHGIIGLALMAIAIIAFVSSPCISKTHKSIWHKITGNTMVLLLVTQFILGLSSVL